MEVSCKVITRGIQDDIQYKRKIANMRSKAIQAIASSQSSSFTIRVNTQTNKHFQGTQEKQNMPEMKTLFIKNIQQEVPKKEKIKLEQSQTIYIQKSPSDQEIGNGEVSFVQELLQLSKPKKRIKFQKKVKQNAIDDKLLKQQAVSHHQLQKLISTLLNRKVDEFDEKQPQLKIQTQFIHNDSFPLENLSDKMLIKIPNHKNPNIGKQFTRYVEENTNLINKILKITEQIKEFSIRFTQVWLNSRNCAFKYDTNYRHILPAFIFVINPFKKNNIRNLRQQNKDCCSKHKTYSQIINKFCDHFMGYCCPINTKQSTYLILWSDYFYAFLIKNFKGEKILKYTTQDLGYYKYLYENTEYSKAIDRQYPNFKNYLGYLHAYIFSHDIIDVCSICRFECPGGFMQLRGKYHHKQCALKRKSNHGLEIRKNKDNLRQFNANLLSISKIEKYYFFCPCSSQLGRMSPNMLLDHIQTHHKLEFVKIYLLEMFK